MAETNDNAIALISNETILKMIAVIEASRDVCSGHAEMSREGGYYLVPDHCMRPLFEALRELEGVQNRDEL